MKRGQGKKEVVRQDAHGPNLDLPSNCAVRVARPVNKKEQRRIQKEGPRRDRKKPEKQGEKVVCLRLVIVRSV